MYTAPDALLYNAPRMTKAQLEKATDYYIEQIRQHKAEPALVEQLTVKRNVVAKELAKRD